MATSKRRSGAASKSAAKKATKTAGTKAGRSSGGSRGAASKGASSSKSSKKAVAAKKTTATKATATKKTATKSTRGGTSSGSAHNGRISAGAASRGRATSAGSRGASAAASRKTASRAASASSRSRGGAAKAGGDPRNDLEKILQDLMQDIYYAEKKLNKALGKMAKKTTNDRLREAFTTHQSQTEDQIRKLERAFEILGAKPKAKKCPAMDGLIDESDEHMQEYAKGAGLDAALIVGAQKVEHYEIATYGSMRSIAQTLGYSDAARIFEQIREQESDTDELLTQIAESVVNLQAEDEAKDVKGGQSSGGGRSSASGRRSGAREGGEDSEAGEDSSSAFSGSYGNNAAAMVGENDGAGRGISALTDGNDRGEASETGEAMGY